MYKNPFPFPLPCNSNNSTLIIVQITSMRMLQTILRHKRRSTNTIRNKILPKIQYPLREFRNAFLAGSILVPRPRELGESGGARPHFGADGRVVGLLGPERCFDAEHERGFGAG